MRVTGARQGPDGNRQIRTCGFALGRGVMTDVVNGDRVTSASTRLSWDAASRVALVGYTAGANLTGEDGTFLVDTLTAWIGPGEARFAVLADARGLGGTDAAYRARVSSFFRGHRTVAFIALFNVSAAIRILTEMFGIGTGVELKAFPGEPAARAWLRTKGFGA